LGDGPNKMAHLQRVKKGVGGGVRRGGLKEGGPSSNYQ